MRPQMNRSQMNRSQMSGVSNEVVSNEVVSNEWSQMNWSQLSAHQLTQLRALSAIPGFLLCLQALSESRRRLVNRKKTILNTTTASATDDNSSCVVGTCQAASEDPCAAKDGNLKAVKNWSQHEIQMLKTSMWIIISFSFCWIPYGTLVLLQDLAPITLKQVHFSLSPSRRFYRLFYLQMLSRVVKS